MTSVGGMEIPTPIPDEKRDGNTNAYGEEISAPELKVERWVNRGVYIFSAIASGLLMKLISAYGGDTTTMVLVLLILVAIFFIKLQSKLRKVINKHLPEEFTEVGVAVLNVADFCAMTAVFIVCSYAIMLLMSMWVYGNLSIWESSNILIIGVFLVNQFSVSYGRLQESLLKAKETQKKVAVQRKNHTRLKSLGLSSSSSSARASVL